MEPLRNSHCRACYYSDGMLERLAEFVALHRMFEAGQRVGVAVSGGADSVFLLHALHELAPRWNLKLSVVHIEHGIRGEASVADAGFVRELAARFALPFHIHAANVLAIHDNLEQAARNVRHAFYRELIAAGTLDRIATGHTRSDQAETVLYRLLRGSGLAGLAGILPVTEEGLVRPLLILERSEIEAWLGERGLAWREDVTNYDLSFVRNRLRHEIFPLLREAFNPRLDEALAHLAVLAQDEERYWEAELDRYVFRPGEPAVLDAFQMSGMPRAAARRMVRRVIEQVRGDLRQIDFDHIERVLDMARATEGHDRIQLPGLDILRSFGWIRISPKGFASGSPRGFSLAIQAPGSVELPGSGACIMLQIVERMESAEPHVTVVDELDWRRIAPNGARPVLELRSWQPGDRYQRAGQSKGQKIKAMFQEARVPLWERRNWPIITYNGSIIWARRFGAAAEFAASPSTLVVLRVGESGAH